MSLYIAVVGCIMQWVGPLSVMICLPALHPRGNDDASQNLWCQINEVLVWEEFNAVAIQHAFSEQVLSVWFCFVFQSIRFTILLLRPYLSGEVRSLLRSHSMFRKSNVQGGLRQVGGESAFPLGSQGSKGRATNGVRGPECLGALLYRTGRTKQGGPANQIFWIHATLVGVF